MPLTKGDNMVPLLYEVKLRDPTCYGSWTQQGNKFETEKPNNSPYNYVNH